MTSKFKQRFAGSFWWSYPLFAALALGYMLLCGLGYSDPVRYTEASTTTPMVRHGQTFKAHFTFYRLQVCELTRLRVIIDGKGGWHEVESDYKAATGPVSKPGDPDEIEVRVKIMPDFEPGLATYRVILSYDCPIQIGPVTIPNLFQQYTPKVVIPPDIRFSILPAKR